MIEKKIVFDPINFGKLLIDFEKEIRSIIKAKGVESPGLIELGTLWGIIQLDDAYWCGKKRDSARGRGASGKTPFLTTVATNLKGDLYTYDLVV